MRLHLPSTLNALESESKRKRIHIVFSVEGRKPIKMKTKNENIIAGACVYSMRAHARRVQLISQRVILTFSQSRSQKLPSLWSALRITNQLLWIRVTQALGRECRFTTFLCGQSKTHQNSSVDANRSMRFR